MAVTKCTSRLQATTSWWAGVAVETLPSALLFVDTGLVGAAVKLAESVIKQARIRLEEDKASEGAGGGGKLIFVPYTVRRLSQAPLLGANGGHSVRSWNQPFTPRRANSTGHNAPGLTSRNENGGGPGVGLSFCV
jgi:hypothetical protein